MACPNKGALSLRGGRGSMQPLDGNKRTPDGDDPPHTYSVIAKRVQPDEAILELHALKGRGSGQLASPMASPRAAGARHGRRTWAGELELRLQLLVRGRILSACRTLAATCKARYALSQVVRRLSSSLPSLTTPHAVV